VNPQAETGLQNVEFPGVKRDIYRGRLLGARHAFIHGSETIDELAARFQVEKRDLTRMSRSEGWPTLRKNKREEQARALEARASVSIIHRRAGFLNDASGMIGKLTDLLNKEMDRIKEGRPNAHGLPPTFADTKAVADSMLKLVQAAKLAYAIPDEVNLPKRRSTGDIIELEPISASESNDPFAIAPLEPPKAPIE